MKLTLQSINDAVSAKFEPLEIELTDTDKVVLRPALRMNSTERAELTAMQAARAKEQAAHEKAVEAYEAAVEAGDEDAVEPVEDDGLVDYLQALISLAIGDKEKAKRLLDAVGDDLAFLIEIVTNYSKSTQPGEASTSES